MSGSTVRTRLLDAPGGGFLLHNADDAAAAKVWISCGEAQALQGQAPVTLPHSPAAADPELEFAIVIAHYEPQRLMIPVLLRLRARPRSDLVKGIHITGAPYASRQVMKGNCFGAISFDNVPVAASDVMSAFISVDAAASPSNRFLLAKGVTTLKHNLESLKKNL